MSGNIVGFIVFFTPLALFALAIVGLGIGTAAYAIGKAIDATVVRIIYWRAEWHQAGSSTVPAVPTEEETT